MLFLNFIIKSWNKIVKYVLKLLEPVLVLLGLLHFKFISSNYCYQSADKVKDNQFKKLKNLLCRSYDEIPFYQNKYNAVGFNPHQDFNSLQDIEKVPYLTKEEARSHQADLVNHKRSLFALTFKTSGSSGHPFTAKISPKHWIIEQSCVWRHWSWAGYNFRDRMAIVRSHVPKNESDLIKWDKLRNFIYFSPFHLSDQDIAMYFERMRELRVVFLRGYPSSILALADYVRRNPETNLPEFKGILTASERLGDKERIIIEKNLKAQVYNHYGLAEQVVMFGGCEVGNKLHNYEEYGYVEFLESDELNKKIIVGTNLNNYAMPLIRYITDDIAQLSEDSCSCSRTSLVIENILGRKDSVIALDDGRKIPITNFYTMFEYYEKEFSSWQLVQVNGSSLKVILDCYQNIDLDKLRSELECEIVKRIGSNVSIEFDFFGGFLQVGEGKKNPFIRLSF
jgi:phenylacetate-CoA ligase